MKSAVRCKKVPEKCPNDGKMMYVTDVEPRSSSDDATAIPSAAAPAAQVPGSSRGRGRGGVGGNGVCAGDDPAIRRRTEYIDTQWRQYFGTIQAREGTAGGEEPRVCPVDPGRVDVRIKSGRVFQPRRGYGMRGFDGAATPASRVSMKNPKFARAREVEEIGSVVGKEDGKSASVPAHGQRGGGTESAGRSRK